jgi:hypothetical protein
MRRNGRDAPISDFPALIPERGGSTHSRPSPEGRNVGDVAPKLPAVVLESELEIAKRVGPRLPPRAIALLFFSIALVRSASAILLKREGPENQHVSTRLDGRDQVSYSSLSALLALRRPAVFSRRGVPWSILKRSTTGVVSMIG